MKAPPTAEAREWAAHAPTCERCRNWPYRICPTGEEILKRAATRKAIDGAHRIFGLTPPTPNGGEHA